MAAQDERLPASFQKYVDERIAAAIEKHEQSAFLHGRDEHRLAHESMERAQQARREIWRALFSHLLGGVAWSVLLLIGVALYQYLKGSLK